MAQETFGSDFKTASPPDVRRGYASPAGREKKIGLRPWFGLWPTRAEPERGAQPLCFQLKSTARRSLASHPAAEPQG